MLIAASVMNKGFGMAGNIHDEDMADPPLRPQSGARCRHFPHEFVGVKAALHQELALALADQLYRAGRRCMAVRGIDDLPPRKVEIVLRRNSSDFCFRSDKHRNDQSGFGSLKRATQ